MVKTDERQVVHTKAVFRSVPAYTYVSNLGQFSDFLSHPRLSEEASWIHIVKDRNYAGFTSKLTSFKNPSTLALFADP